ncbi:MAG TPA: hypothetical protein VGU69_07005 [Rhizomicrobium sp.]|nr:hypothetical protein [Rhizomicrobium sp.]
MPGSAFAIFHPLRVEVINANSRMANGREKGVMLRDRAFSDGSHGDIGQSEIEKAIRPDAKCGNNLAMLATVERALTENRIAPLPKPRPIAMPVQQIPIWTAPRVIVALLRGSRRFARKALFGPAIVSESDPYA